MKHYLPKNVGAVGAVFLLSAFLWTSCPTYGQELGVIKRFRELSEENQELRARLEKLEKVIDGLQQKQETPVVAVSPVVPETKAEVKPDVKKAEKPIMRSKNQIDTYGFVKLDTFLDSSRSDVGNYVRWVNSETKNPDDSQFGMNTHHSRFGFNIKGPDEGNMKTIGNLEFELYGGGAETKPNLGMRHAFFQFNWANEDCSLIMGQTWDLISPLLPSLLNYNPAWWAGNIGLRHPQIRFTKGVKTSKRSKLTFAIAAARAVGDVGPFTLNDSGIDSGQPILEGRVGFQFPTFGANSATIGVSGHTGKDEYDYAATGANSTIESNSIGVDLSVPISKLFAFKGEYWKGKNMDQFAGGIGQGSVVSTASTTGLLTKELRFVNATKFEGVFQKIESLKSQGGWVELNFGPFSKKWRFNVGSGMDNPDDEILPDASRVKNSSRWANATYDLNDSVQLGLEFSRWITSYKNAVDGDDTRFQSSCIFKF